MRGYLILAAVAAGIAAAILLQFDGAAELVGWEILLIALLVFLWRVLPVQDREQAPSLFPRSSADMPIPPRSVSSFELAAVHAFSESPGADRRLKILMARIASHRLSKRGIAPGSARANELIDPSLYQERAGPLTRPQIARIVEQMEDL